MILGSPNIADYPVIIQNKSGKPGGHTLIYAKDAKNIALTGRGKINGRGNNFEIRDAAPGRPYGILLVDCTDVLIDPFMSSNPSSTNE